MIFNEFVDNGFHEIQDFGTLLAERGLGSYQQPQEVYSYTRDELLAFKDAMAIAENVG